MHSLVRMLLKEVHDREPRAIARAISIVENGKDKADAILSGLDSTRIEQATIIGITGPPGAGKSTLTSRLIAHYRSRNERIGIIAIDPTSPISGGAILGDRIRMMDHALDPDVVIRSMATRGRLGGLCAAAAGAARIMAASGCTTIIIETVGVGQSEMDIIRVADITALILAPGLGDDIQAMKAGLLEVVDVLVVNKSDCHGADALAMDLQAAIRDGGGKKFTPKVLMTSASENRGIIELADTIYRIDASHRQTGERKIRRKLSFEIEVLDWALEIIKPKLKQIIEQTSPSMLTGDPMRRAREVLKKFT